MAFLIVAMSLSEEILVRPYISRFLTIFLKYLLKISANSCFSEITLLFLFKVIFHIFKSFYVNKGFTVI